MRPQTQLPIFAAESEILISRLPLTYELSKFQECATQLTSTLRTVENHGNTEITETVIFVKCRDFAKIPCLPCFWPKCRVFHVFAIIFFNQRNLKFIV